MRVVTRKKHERTRDLFNSSTTGYATTIVTLCSCSNKSEKVGFEGLYCMYMRGLFGSLSSHVHTRDNRFLARFPVCEELCIKLGMMPRIDILKGCQALLGWLPLLGAVLFPTVNPKAE